MPPGSRVAPLRFATASLQSGGELIRCQRVFLAALFAIVFVSLSEVTDRDPRRFVQHAAVGNEAVSYTHLDVYKRQPPSSTGWTWTH